MFIKKTIHPDKYFIYLQVTPNGGPLCVKCDYAIVSFQRLKDAIKIKQVPDQSDADKKSKTAEKSDMKPKEHADLPHSNKRMKTSEFSVDDEVKFFDKQTGKNEIAVVSKVVSDGVYMIGVTGKKAFYINGSLLTKLEN